MYGVTEAEVRTASEAAQIAREDAESSDGE
nr:MAG TPA: hypothetical protein [Caudoviricetes sp.]